MKEPLGTALRRAAGDDPPTFETDDVERRVQRRLRRRRLAGSVAALVFVVVVGAVVVRGTADDGTEVAGGGVPDDPYCQTLHEPVWGRTDDGSPVDAIVFVVADADEATRAAAEDAVRSDPSVSSVRVITQADAYEEFRSLFADTPEMLEAVRPEILPSSIRVALDLDGPVDADAWADAVDVPGVFQVVTASNTFPHGQRFGDGLLRPVVAARIGDVAPVVVSGPLVEAAMAAAPDDLVADLETLARAIVGTRSVEVTPEMSDAAGRLLDHAEIACGLHAH